MFHFTERETEADRGEDTSLKLDMKGKKVGLDSLNLSGSRAPALHHEGILQLL